jgi:superfamily II DNA or RNA helicase
MLEACFGRERSAPATPGLEPFQASAHHRLRTIIADRGGAILADSVGLGKTHVAVALIRDELDAGRSAVVVAPAQLRAHWKRHLRGMSDCRVISHTALSRAAPRIAPPGLVVVDEAHAFRNPLTRRYAALAGLCEPSRVLLLTATPVNNSLLDFHHLVRLFSASDTFSDIGVPDLLAAVESAIRGGATAELRAVANAVIVRRTRRAAMSWQTQRDGVLPGTGVMRPPAAAPTLRFPARGPVELLHYDLRDTAPDLLDCVRAVIPALVFPAHNLAGVTRAPGDAAAIELMRLGLLKRLESSSWALRASVRRHIRILDHFIAAADAGLLFDPLADRAELGEVDGAVQLSLQSLALRPWPASLDRDRLTGAAELDLRALRRLHAVLPADAAQCDPKLERLTALIGGELRDDVVLLFTEYQDTARGLWRALAHLPGVALVHGSEARLGRGRASRRAVIERFAPRANGARLPRTAERVRLLIATDVLAEGMNLQDASAVISYDLPWNPVRVAQRIGRIDRLGSPHTHIRAFAFVPDRGIDVMLGLMKRIRRKLRHIRVVGGDAPWSLGNTNRHTQVIDEIDAAGDARERARAVWLDSSARAVRLDIAGRECVVAAGPCAAAAGVARRSRDRDAALCCFRMRDRALLVLIADGQRAQIDTAMCWSAVIDAIDAGAPVAGGTCHSDADASTLDRDAAAAERAARRAIRARRSRPAAHRAGGAALAAAVVQRWLAQRPGGPSAHEADVADRILRGLNAGLRAGADIRFERLVRNAASPVDAVRQLADLSADSLSQGPNIATRAPRRDRTGPAPELVGVLLLRGATRQ